MPNYVDPVKRDVVSVGVPGDNVTIRFTVSRTFRSQRAPGSGSVSDQPLG